MKINFTKKEYRTLLEMLYISDWVLNSFSNSLEEQDENHKALREKIYSFHKEMQVVDWIHQDNEDCYETAEFDEHMHHKYIDEYNQNVFWEALIDQLSYRDLANEIGIEAFKRLEPLARMEKLEKFRERYANEFEKNQLDYVKIDSSGAINN